MCIAAASACLLFAQSAGSWVVISVLLIYYWLIRFAPVSGKVLLLIVCGITVSVFAAFFFFSEEVAVIVGRDETLSGRTLIWPIVLDAIWQKPFLGYGYVAATADFMRPYLVSWVGTAAVNAHNGYLDVLLGTGLVGLLSLLFCISSVLARGIDRMKLSGRPESGLFDAAFDFSHLQLIVFILRGGNIRGSGHDRRADFFVFDRNPAVFAAPKQTGAPRRCVCQGQSSFRSDGIGSGSRFLFERVFFTRSGGSWRRQAKSLCHRGTFTLRRRRLCRTVGYVKPLTNI